MSYRVYHDYDDDRDVITCITLSDTRPGGPPNPSVSRGIRGVGSALSRRGRRATAQVDTGPRR
jgi:hypothetical protein